MESYTLEKTGLELTGGRLVKKDKKGAVEASLDVAKIKRAYYVSAFDPMGIVITVGVLCLTFVFFRLMPDGLWRWVTVVISATAFCACTLGVKARFIVVEVGRDILKYQSLDVPDRVPSFVAMINQASEGEWPIKNATPNGGPGASVDNSNAPGGPPSVS